MTNREAYLSFLNDKELAAEIIYKCVEENNCGYCPIQGSAYCTSDEDNDVDCCVGAVERWLKDEGSGVV